jgi:hypothetical protein
MNEFIGILFICLSFTAVLLWLVLGGEGED